jgi:hypothetical protein
MKKIIELKNGDLVRLNGKGEIMRVQHRIHPRGLENLDWYWKVLFAVESIIVFPIYLLLADDFVFVKKLNNTDIMLQLKANKKNEE